MRALVMLPALLALGSCSHELRIDRSGNPADIRGCEARGGHVEGRGMFGIRTCVTPYSDAGRACTDKAQCAGRCLLLLGTTETNGQSYPVGREVSGQCERDDRTVGCFVDIRDGRVSEEGGCVD
jgi:hypothetical protein